MTVMASWDDVPGGTAPLARCFHRRVRLWERADQLGNVPLACRQLGISRTRYYEWSKIADAYGVNA